MIYRETDKPQPEYDGHHIQTTLDRLSGPHKKLLERGLISEESDQPTAFLDIVDVGQQQAAVPHRARDAA